jgi:hypothetical protein
VILVSTAFRRVLCGFQIAERRRVLHVEDILEFRAPARSRRPLVEVVVTLWSSRVVGARGVAEHRHVSCCMGADRLPRFPYAYLPHMGDAVQFCAAAIWE